MANPDFKKIVVKDVEFVFPRLNQAYRYNERDEQSEPCADTAPNAARSVAWKMDEDAGKALWTELKKHYEECKTRNKKLPAFKSVFSMKKIENEDGTKNVQFSAKKNAMTRSGEPARPVIVVGPDLKDLEDKAIWSGSRGHIRAQAVPATNPQSGEGGITLLLDAVQVTDPVYGGNNLADDFGAPEPSFGDDAPKSNPADDVQPAELEDDITF